MSFSTAKQGIEESIEQLRICSSLEFRKVYPRILGEINSFPVKDTKN